MSYILYNSKTTRCKTIGDVTPNLWITRVTYSNVDACIYTFYQGRFLTTNLEKLQVRTAIESLVSEEDRSKYILILKL